VPRARLEALFRQNPYLPGARETVQALRARGVRIAIVSTGLLIHAAQVQADLEAEYVVANEILFEGGRVSGAVRAHIPEGGKGVVMDDLLARTGVRPAECLAVGDGESDVALFQRAGVSVAVAPCSERVRAAADIVLSQPDLRPLLDRLRAFDPTLLEDH
jgi:phosphoserine phosphatase